MARKRTRLMTLFSLVAVLALAGMGLTYTLWSETVEIDGTVNTGSVDVEISATAPLELVDQGYGPDVVPGNKDTVDCQVAGAPGTGEEHPGDTVNTGDGALTITVDGLFPSYYCIVTVAVTNIGTVPVHVNQPDLVTGSNALVEFGTHDAFTTGTCYAEDTQIHNGESAYCDIIIHFDNTDNLSEGTEYTFQFSILAHQWNEAA